MRRNLQGKNMVIVAHRVFPSIVDALKRYAVEHEVGNLWYIIHEFANLETRRSFIEYYRDGRLVEERYGRDYRFLPEPLVNVKDFLYTFCWLLFKARDVDLYLGEGGFDVLPGILLKRVKRIKKVVFYTIDYVPVRFENRLLNEIYHRVDRFALRHSTETWNLSPRMAEGRREVRGLDPRCYPPQVVVQHGLWLDDVTRYGCDEINRNELIFIGHLVEKAGVQLVIEAIPRILEKLPQFHFRVIGTGAYAETLQQLARELGVESHVTFEGAVPDQRDADEMLARAAVAVAMYDRTTDDFTYYADPGKLKTYLSAGLPILLTDLPHNADEIAAEGAGRVIDFDADSIADAVIELMQDEGKLAGYRENAALYAERFDWNRLFGENLERLLNGGAAQ